MAQFRKNTDGKSEAEDPEQEYAMNPPAVIPFQLANCKLAACAVARASPQYEVLNLLDRNLAVQACAVKRLPKQVLTFDPNEGAGFWWANGLNTFTRNVSVENDEYGYRYDLQKRSNFDTTLPIRQPDGSEKMVDVRKIPIWRFEDNEAHSEGFYGMVVAANGNDQPDTPIPDDRMLRR